MKKLVKLLLKNKMTEPIKLPKHIHLYKKINIVPSWKSKLPETHKHYRPSHFLFSCQAPLCGHTLELNKAVGKLASCNVCLRPFVMTKESVQRSKPRCSECIVRVKKDEIVDLEDFLMDKDI